MTSGGESVSRAVYGCPPCFTLRATLAELALRLATALLCAFRPSRNALWTTFAGGSCAAFRCWELVDRHQPLPSAG